MIIGERLKELRESKQMSQGDIEKRTGLLRCYVSRVENGHTVPAIETLEKMARAMDVPMYVLFYDGEKPPVVNLPPTTNGNHSLRGAEARRASRFGRILHKISPSDRTLLMHLANKMAMRSKRRA